MQTIILELCNENPPLGEERHFPEDDFIDLVTGAQYFLHRHHSAEVGETTHIHIFKRWSSHDVRSLGLESVTTHLAALALDSTGQPDYWFVVNQWVVGDYWLPAENTIELFRGWSFSEAECQKNSKYGFWHEWVAKQVNKSLETDIFSLLNERDRILDQLVDLRPGENVLEDRSIEVICCSRVNPYRAVP